MLNSVSNNVVNFKTTPINYNTRKTPPMPTEPSIDDMFMMQQLAEKQQAKKEKSKEKWYKTGVIAQVALAAAFVTMAGISVYGLLQQAGKGGNTKLKFEDITKRFNFPKLEDDCVNPKVRDFIKRMKNNAGLSEEVKKLSGAKKSEQFLLMYGPPGTGKTFSAQMMAKELGAEYAEVQFADVSSPYVGQTAVEIKNVFATLQKKAQKEPNKKFLVTFNEVDALLVPSEKCGETNLHLAQNRTAFLNGLDSIKELKNVKIVGTTNIDPKSGNLDKASLSRIGNMLEIDLPTEKELVAALKFNLEGNADAVKNHKFFESNKGALEKFAKEMHDKKYSLRDVKLLSEDAMGRFGEAISSSKNLSSEKFDMKFLKEAFDAKGLTTGEIGAEIIPAWQKIKAPNQKPTIQMQAATFWEKIKALFGG